MNLIQARMARGALNWTSSQLAREAGLRRVTVARYLGGAKTEDFDIKRLQSAFEAAGVTFLRDANDLGVGVRLKVIKLKKPPAIGFPGPATDAVKMMDAAIEEHEAKPKRLLGR